MESNTGYYATVVADSIAPNGSRLATLEICFPRFILAEFNTHRVFSRNSASSRAIPVAKQIERVVNHPFVPVAFPINKPGMRATEYLRSGDAGYNKARDTWLFARDVAVQAAELLLEQDIHKQTANRLLEPFMWHTVVCTASDWENFFNLRISEFAQPEIKMIAEMMAYVMDQSVPALRKVNEWHIPYVDPSEHIGMQAFDLARISAGRCAAVTLLNQQKKEPEKDLQRCDKLMALGHMSPLEHPAQVWDSTSGEAPSGSNFNRWWTQLRKMIPGEAVYKK